jgi:toxin ParE1/3/4
MEEIRVWDAAQGAADVGARLVGTVVSQVERLSDFPESGRIVPEFGVVSLREIIYPPFRMVYRFDRNRVRIVRMWRSERVLQMPS